MATVPLDMTLVINVTVSGSVDANNVMTISGFSFTPAACVPPAKQGAVIVQQNGDIDLTKMTGGTDFTEGTDIYFVLSGEITGPTGKVFPIFFEPPANRAVTMAIMGSGTGVPGFNPILPGTGDNSVLLIDDLDRSHKRYKYTLHLLSYVNPAAPAKGVIDPAIVNRGDGID